MCVEGLEDNILALYVKCNVVFHLHYVYTCLAFIVAYHFFQIYGVGNSNVLVLLLNSLLLPCELNIVFVLQNNMSLSTFFRKQIPSPKPFTAKCITSV
jgi:hypothetical protein